jgi:hypothetical protein
MIISFFWTSVVSQKSGGSDVTPLSVDESANSPSWEADVKKSHLLSLTSIAAMMLGVTAAQNALAESAHKSMMKSNNQMASPSPGAVDPGVRGGPAGAGSPVGGLTSAEQAFFTAATARFEGNGPLRPRPGL